MSQIQMFINLGLLFLIDWSILSLDKGNPPIQSIQVEQFGRALDLYVLNYLMYCSRIRGYKKPAKNHRKNYRK